MKIYNVSNNLKNKIINKDNITIEEEKTFIEYMINKTKIIANNMYNKNNSKYLLYEICYSYNLIGEPIKFNNEYLILKMKHNKYLIDINYKGNIENLRKNKYIKYNKEIFNKYKIECGINE